MKQTFPIPKTKDPFINTPLIRAGFDPKSGAERFFISTYNANVGCTCALVDTNGNFRLYQITKGDLQYTGCGAYSACMTDDDTVWMVSQIARPLRLTLSTGEQQYFDSGAPFGLVFAGMQYDKATGKFLAVSCQHERICGLSFDVRAEKAAKIHQGFSKATYCHGGFPNPDGKTYTMRMSIGHNALCKWDPEAETLTEMCEIDARAECFRVIFDENGLVYIPYTGWVDTADYSISRERMPERECCWFGRLGNTAYGIVSEATEAEILAWDLASGKVRTLCTVADSGHACAALTESGEILVVNVYGEVFRFDLNSGACLMHIDMQVSAEGRLDCLMQVNDRLILGTPYITQRFWLMDTESGKGFDAGRAAPGAGEVLKLWNMGGKVYMASYTEGVLTEFDPTSPLEFPKNPRVVATPRHSMRPFADAQDGTCLYYACNHPYGEYGCELTRYNTVTGEVLYHDDPVPYQEITSLILRGGVLYGATTIAADSDSLVPKAEKCALVKIDPNTLKVTETTHIDGAFTQLLGEADTDTALILVRAKDKTERHYFFAYESGALIDCALPSGRTVQASGKDGLFVLASKEELELWRITPQECTRLTVLAPLGETYGVHISGDSVLLAEPVNVHLFDGILKEYR